MPPRLGGSPCPGIEAYLELHHFKHLYRQGWLRVGIPRETCESVAEHSARLPHGPEYLALWEEYERGTSLEARLVRQVDRLEMGLRPGD